ncbi:MAG: signal peptidase I [Tepidisphaeraceae bacterium]
MDDAVASTPPGTNAPAAPSTAKKSAHHGGIKETVEQILIAFILAFVFRCFIVEAFVIPTGSMAPTLLGAHMTFRCPDCGYRFTVDYPNATQGNEIVIPDKATGQTYPIRCPNCAYLFPPTTGTDPEGTAREPAVQYGDRILVQKYLYLLHEPQRWDVVVFKSPADDAGTIQAGDRFMQNYIKRLIGRPGETIIVVDGDVYVSTSDKPIDKLTAADFQIQSKPWAAQQALWRVVYDNDYRPRGLPRTYEGQIRVEDPWRQPWTSESKAWDTSSDVLKVNAGANAPAELRYDFENTMTARRPLTDWLSYDVTRMGTTWGYDAYASTGEPRAVSDVMLAVTYKRLSGAGPLRLKTTKRDTEFVAEVSPDDITLTMQRPAGPPQTIGKASISGLGSGSGSRIELVCVDYRLSVRVDGKEVLSSTREQFSPDLNALLNEFLNDPHAVARNADQYKPNVRIEAVDQQAELSHVSLWRDVYYLNYMTKPTGRFEPIDWASPSIVAGAAPDRPADAARQGRILRHGRQLVHELGRPALGQARRLDRQRRPEGRRRPRAGAIHAGQGLLRLLARRLQAVARTGRDRAERGTDSVHSLKA